MLRRKFFKMTEVCLKLIARRNSCLPTIFNRGGVIFATPLRGKGSCCIATVAGMKKAVNTFVRFGYRRPPPWRIPISKHPFQNGETENATASKLNDAPNLYDNGETTTSSTAADGSSHVHGRKFRSKTICNDDMEQWERIKTEPINLEAVKIDQQGKIPSLAHGIDVVLKGDGLYPLEAPWVAPSGMYQRSHRKRLLFSNGLRRITQPDRIAWHQIPPYIPASQDNTLHDLATTTDGVSFCSSTSSIVPSLSLLYHVISNFRNTYLQGGLSSHVQDLPSTFSKMHRRPVAVTVQRASSIGKKHTQRPNSLSDNDRDDVDGKKSVYVINAHSGLDRGPSILRDLGHSMERMLTTPPAEFAERYIKQGATNYSTNFDQPTQNTILEHSKQSSPYSSVSYFDATHSNNNQPTKGAEAFTCENATGTEIHSDEDQFYNYSRASRMLLRAQIDCVDEMTGEVFDLKTRAVAPIRYDLANYGAFTSHRLRFLQGRIDSYEREFYDMVRSVFLKYALQLRIGRMNGALVAYHNTTELLGLEYIRLKEIESYVFGSSRWANIAFATCVRLFESIVSTVISRTIDSEGTSNDKVKIVLSNEWSNTRMFVFAQQIPSKEEDPFSPESFELFHKTNDSGKVNTEDEEKDLTLEVNGGQDDDVQTSRLKMEDLGNSAEPFLRHSLWQYDSFLHMKQNEGAKGVSIVGSHPSVEQFGGELVSGPEISSTFSPSPRNSSTSSAAYASWVSQLNKDDLPSRKLLESLMNRDAFRAWEVNVAAFVNGKLQSRAGVNLNEEDEFELRYTMSEVEKIEHEHITKFLFALGSVYLR